MFPVKEIVPGVHLCFFKHSLSFPPENVPTIWCNVSNLYNLEYRSSNINTERKLFRHLYVSMFRCNKTACTELDWEGEGSWFKPQYQQTMEGIPVVGTRITSELCPGALE